MAVLEEAPFFPISKNSNIKKWAIAKKNARDQFKNRKGTENEILRFWVISIFPTINFSDFEWIFLSTNNAARYSRFVDFLSTTHIYAG